jgi:hypothetical protein
MGRRAAKPATNSLSYGTAWLSSLVHLVVLLQVLKLLTLSAYEEVGPMLL